MGFGKNDIPGEMTVVDKLCAKAQSAILIPQDVLDSADPSRYIDHLIQSSYELFTANWYVVKGVAILVHYSSPAVVRSYSSKFLKNLGVPSILHKVSYAEYRKGSFALEFSLQAITNQNQYTAVTRGVYYTTKISRSQFEIRTSLQLNDGMDPVIAFNAAKKLI